MQRKNNKDTDGFELSKLDVFHKLPQAVLCSFLFEHSRDVVVLIDPMGTVMMVSRACARLLGGEPEDFIGHSLEEVLQDEFSEEREKRITQIVASGKGASWEREIKIRGENRWLKTVVEPIFEADGSVGALLVMAVDITDEKRTEGEIRSLEERYTRLFETVQEAILITDDTGNYVDANPFSCELLGYTREEILQLSSWAIVPGVNRDIWVPVWEKFLEDGAMSGEYQVQRKDGTILDLHFNAIANFYPGHHLSMLTDITAQKEAERALQASEERYSHLVQESPTAILVIQDGKYVFANPKAAEVMGYQNPNDVVGLEVFESFSERSKEMVAERVKRAEGGIGNEFTLLEIQRSDGTSRMIEATSVPHIYDNAPAILVMGYDVTEREFTSSRLSSFYQVAPIGAGVLANRCFQEVNQQFCDITGYSAEELVGQDSRMLYFSDEEYEVVGQDKVRQIQEKGEAVVETRFRRKDGEMVHIVLSTMPLDPKDLSKGLSATILDITKRKQAEEALQQLNEELEERVMQRTVELRQKNLDLEAFSYSISHDLRAPLRAINGFSQILLNEHIPEWDTQAVSLFERILVAGRHMDLLIEGMLLLAELGQQKLRLYPVDLGQLAEQIFNDMMVHQPDRKVKGFFHKGITIWVDIGIMRVALSNLISNAIKFTESCEIAEIEFGYEEVENGEVIFSLRDNGSGFNPEFYDKLFVPFQRLEENVELEGLGLGLAVVKKVIERHDGEIWAESKKGKGATFYFRLQTTPEQLINTFQTDLK